MKQYNIFLEQDISEIYEAIANVCGKPPKEILKDTLLKVIDVILGRISPNN